MTHRGSCHCGRIAENVRFLTPESDASEYLFNKHHIHHRFCPTCGIHPYAVGKEPKQGRDMAAINVRCLEDVDPAALQVKAFDGRSL
jgi:hypothetical protein